MGASDKAYDILRQRLIGGYYSPGAQLKEEPIARELELSRTPVRSALKRLVQDGLVNADVGQGVHAPHWSEGDIEETFQLRLMLEPYAASLAAQKGGDDMVLQLRDSNLRMSNAIQANDIDGIQQANRAFHATLLAHCGSPRLRSILELMIDVPIIVRSFYLSNRDDLEQSLSHHELLTRAAAARDGDLAMDAMRLHLRMSHQRFLQHRESFQQSTPQGDASEPKGQRKIQN